MTSYNFISRYLDACIPGCWFHVGLTTGAAWEGVVIDSDEHTLRMRCAHPTERGVDVTVTIDVKHIVDFARR